MSVTATRSTGTSPDGPDVTDRVQALVEQLVRQSRGRVVGTRDLGDDVQPPDPVVAGEGEQDRFLGSLLQTLLPVVINTVPPVLQALASQRRDVGLPEAQDPAALERDFTLVLTGLLKQLVVALPRVETALSVTRDLPAGGDPAEDVTERWFLPLLTTIGPALAQAVPGILQAVTGRREFREYAPITSPEIAECFLPPIFGPLAAGLMQATPAVMHLVQGQRELHLTFDAFSGQWMPAGDAIRMVESDIGDPAFIEFQLRQPYRTWFKGLEVHIAGTRVAELTCEGNGRRESDVFRIQVGRLTGTGFLRFVKAAMFGVHTGFYELRGLEQKRGKRLVVEWLHD